MKLALRKLLPKRISGQIAILIIASIASVHVILTAIFLLRAREVRPPLHPGQIEMAAALLDLTDAADRARVFAAIANDYTDLALKLDRSKADDWTTRATSPDLGWFGRNLPPGLAVRRDPEG